LAKLLGSNVEDIALTGTRHMMGTPHYMAPEQMEHPKEVDHRADIYSLGVVFYELLTGELPLGRFAPPSQKVQVDVRLDEVVLRTLEHEPERRYQQAKEVKNRVQNIADTTQRQPGDDDTDNEATETGAIASERRRVPVRRSLVIAAISILIVGLPLFLLRYRDSGKVIAIRENPPGFGHVTHDSRWCNYIIEVPANHRLNFWIEWWQDGRKSNRTDFTVSDSFAPSRGRPFSGYADLAIWTAASPPGSSNNYVKWQWGLRGSGALSGLGNMAQDPFQGMTVRDSSFGHSPSRMVKPGEIVTLVVLRGDTDFLQGDPWDPRVAGRADVEMHLKARFDALAKADLSDEPKSGPAVVR
jgi:serine/threonine protein kinase